MQRETVFADNYKQIHIQASSSLACYPPSSAPGTRLALALYLVEQWVKCCLFFLKISAIFQLCPAHKADVQGCPTRLSYKAIVQGCHARLSCKAVVQGCCARLSYKAVVQGYRTRLSYKAVVQDCHTRLSYKTVVQGCRTRLSYKANVHR